MGLNANHRELEIVFHFFGKWSRRQRVHVLKPIDASASLVSRIKAPPLRVDFVEERQQTMIWEQPFRVELG